MTAATMNSYQTIKRTINDTSGSTSSWNHDWIKATKKHTSSYRRSRDDSLCGESTRDGDSCRLNGVFSDGRCHWHTEEQCFRMTEDDTPCELPGSRDDGACHIHTRGCNESLGFTAVQKACFHGMKFPYRMLGLHPDTKRSGGPFDIAPQMAAEVAALVGKTYLETIGESYDREASHEYYERNIVSKVTSDDGIIDKMKSAAGLGPDGQETRLEVFKKGMKQAWKQVGDKEHHADGARTAIVASEFFLGQNVELEI